MQGIINRIVGEVVGRPSVRGSWGSLVSPLTPVADPPAAIGFDALPAPEAPMPETSDAGRVPEKKKKEGSGNSSGSSSGWESGEQTDATARGGWYPERRTDETTWAKVVGKGEKGAGETAPPYSHRRLQAGSRNRVGATAGGDPSPQ